MTEFLVADYAFFRYKLLIPPPLNTALREPYCKQEDFKAYCGAGQGIGEMLVPETVFGLRISLACFLHDVSWIVADGSWGQFHHANSAFFYNLRSIIYTDSRGSMLAWLRMYRATTYLLAVDKFGPSIYKQLHKQYTACPAKQRDDLARSLHRVFGPGGSISIVDAWEKQQRLRIMCLDKYGVNESVARYMTDRVKNGDLSVTEASTALGITPPDFKKLYKAMEDADSQPVPGSNQEEQGGTCDA